MRATAIRAAHMLSAVCTHEGSDPRGRVVSGYLKLQAPLIRTKVVTLGVRNNPGEDESNSYVVLRIGEQKATYDLDNSACFGKGSPCRSEC